MPSSSKPLGVLRPLGGGDPIPLTRPELLVGRRPTCDIRLDFENISGKHCQLRYAQGVWHVRDLGSTNGTSVNGQKIDAEHSVMPDDELGLASHVYAIDYDPAVAPGSLIDANQFLGEEAAAPRRRSLLELAGLESPESARQGQPATQPARSGEPVEPGRAEPSRDEPSPVEEPPDAPLPALANTSDDEFFDMIRQDVESEETPRKPKSR